MRKDATSVGFQMYYAAKLPQGLSKVAETARQFAQEVDIRYSVLTLRFVWAGVDA